MYVGDLEVDLHVASTSELDTVPFTIREKLPVELNGRIGDPRAGLETIAFRKVAAFTGAWILICTLLETGFCMRCTASVTSNSGRFTGYFNRRHAVVVSILKIKWFYFVETQQQHTIISTLVWLRVSVSSRPSSGQHFPVEGTIGVHYTLWGPILFTGCA